MHITQVYQPDASGALADLAQTARASVVQVRSGGRGNGTGVVWRADGAILTNDHVVAHARGPVQVLLADGRELRAEVKARAPELDLALLQVEANDLPTIQVADSRTLRIGELVFAIGHPWGQPWVTTAGIVSGLGEVPVEGGRRNATYIRSDVRLAPGNSGGPLLNASGAVVGINAMIFGGDLAVAIPSHIATEWLSREPTQPRGRLGVALQPAELPDALRQAAWANRTAGLMVTAVEPGSPAAAAPLMIGDVLLDAGGHSLESVAGLRDALAERPGAPLRLYLLRAGAVIAVDVAVG